MLFCAGHKTRRGRTRDVRCRTVGTSLDEIMRDD
jgi:hypothetical protein